MTQQNTSTVYVINQPLAPRRPVPGQRAFVYDVSPAQQYGAIKFVFTEEDPRPTDNPDAAIEHAHKVLSAITEDDYIVWAGGDPLSMVIVSSIVADLLGGRIKYLAFEKNRQNPGQGYYVPKKLSIFDEEEDD